MGRLDAVFGVGEDRSGAPGAEQRVEQLLALNRAAIAITSELELDKLLHRIVDVARDVAGCKYAALGVLGEDGFIERFPTSGISDVDREKIGDPPRGHGLLGVMLKAGRSLRIPDISKDPRRVGFPAHHPPMTSLLGVPIFVRGKLVGDLYLTDKYDEPEFSEEDEWLVQLLATHAATALTNSHLHAENVQALQTARRQRARAQALFKVTQAINHSMHLDEVIPLILGSTVELLGAAGAAILLMEQPTSASGSEARDQGRRFLARHAIGLEESHTTEPTLLPMQGSVAGRAVASGATQVVSDTEEEPETVFPRLAGKALRSLVVVPLVASGQTLGVLSAYSDHTAAFDQEAVELQEAFAAAASTALYHATLYQEAQRGREAAEREQQRLREVEQMKDEFLSTAAHELRTPLTTIEMSAGLAYEQVKRLAALDELDSRVVDLMALVLEGSERMHSLVNDLLDLTRLEQGRTTLQLEELDMHEVVTASAQATKPLFEGKGQQISVHLPEMRCGVRGDRQRLEQVLINLLSNAHKYTPGGSNVEIRIVRSGGKCRVSVRDNGPGVPPEEREEIFESFYRSSLHRQDRTASTGLGLPIARTIAEMHGGAPLDGTRARRREHFHTGSPRQLVCQLFHVRTARTGCGKDFNFQIDAGPGIPARQVLEDPTVVYGVR